MKNIPKEFLLSSSTDYTKKSVSPTPPLPPPPHTPLSPSTHPLPSAVRRKAQHSGRACLYQCLWIPHSNNSFEFCIGRSFCEDGRTLLALLLLLLLQKKKDKKPQKNIKKRKKRCVMIYFVGFLFGRSAHFQIKEDKFQGWCMKLKGWRERCIFYQTLAQANIMTLDSCFYRVKPTAVILCSYCPFFSTPVLWLLI